MPAAAAGYRAALKAPGIKARPEWIVRGGFKESDGYRAMPKLLSLTSAHRRRVRRQRSIGHRRDEGDLGRRPRVPDDIAVIGAGHIAPRRSAPRPADHGQLVARGPGPRAAELLLDRVEAGARNGFRRVVVEPQLVARASTAV